MHLGVCQKEIKDSFYVCKQKLVLKEVAYFLTEKSMVIDFELEHREVYLRAQNRKLLVYFYKRLLLDNTLCIFHLTCQAYSSVAEALDARH